MILVSEENDSCQWGDVFFVMRRMVLVIEEKDYCQIGEGLLSLRRRIMVSDNWEEWFLSVRRLICDSKKNYSCQGELFLSVRMILVSKYYSSQWREWLMAVRRTILVSEENNSTSCHGGEWFMSVKKMTLITVENYSWLWREIFSLLKTMSFIILTTSCKMKSRFSMGALHVGFPDAFTETECYLLIISTFRDK